MRIYITICVYYINIQIINLLRQQYYGRISKNLFFASKLKCQMLQEYVIAGIVNRSGTQEQKRICKHSQ